MEQFTMDEIIHQQTSKVGLIAAEIAKTLAAPELATRENVAMLHTKLENWRLEVPTMLQIPTLTSANPPELTLYQRRAILMVHVCIFPCLFRYLANADNEHRLCTLAHWYCCTANFWLQQQRHS